MGKESNSWTFPFSALCFQDSWSESIGEIISEIHRQCLKDVGNSWRRKLNGRGFLNAPTKSTLCSPSNVDDRWTRSDERWQCFETMVSNTAQENASFFTQAEGESWRSSTLLNLYFGVASSTSWIFNKASLENPVCNIFQACCHLN